MLRTLTLSGTPTERGRAHGEALRAEIHRGLARFQQMIVEHVRVDPVDYVREFLGAVDFADAIAAWAPDALEELRGIAAGCGVPFQQLYAYNLVDELWLWSEERGDVLVTGEAPPGCTVMGIAQGPAGVPLLAQSMDIPLQYCDTEVALRIQREGRPDLWTVTPAGMLNTCGWNDAGVGVCTNTLMGLRHARHGLPMLFVVRVVLDAPTRAEAAARVRALPHASGQCYTIGDPSGLTALECSATTVVEYDAGAPVIAHTNHPLANEDVDERMLAVDFEESQLRQAFAELAAEDAADADAIKRLLADRTVPVCKVGAELSDTTRWAAFVMELTAPPRVEVSVGPPPHLARYERVAGWTASVMSSGPRR